MDQVRATDLRPGELRAEIGQLEDEKKQLTEKIAKLKANVSEEPGKIIFCCDSCPSPARIRVRVFFAVLRCAFVASDDSACSGTAKQALA